MYEIRTPSLAEPIDTVYGKSRAETIAACARAAGFADVTVKSAPANRRGRPLLRVVPS